MIITLTPDDIIKRCLWTAYKRFALRDKKEVEIGKLITENLPISMDEEMAYVIGLLKVIETDKLSHRFQNHMIDILKIKSTIQENEVYISIRVIDIELDGFQRRFPNQWKPESSFETGLVELNDYIKRIKEKLPQMEIHEFKVKDRMVKYYLSKELKKLIDKSSK